MNTKQAKETKERRSVFWLYFLMLMPVFLYAGFKYFWISLLLTLPISIFLFKKYITKKLPLKIIVIEHLAKLMLIFFLVLIPLYISRYPMIQPPILIDAPSHDKFKIRVKEKYPEGTPHEEIVRSLKWQMFDIKYIEKNQRYHAVYNRNAPFFCVKDWNISWETDDKEIRGINAYVGSACL